MSPSTEFAGRLSRVVSPGRAAVVLLSALLLAEAAAGATAEMPNAVRALAAAAGLLTLAFGPGALRRGLPSETLGLLAVCLAAGAALWAAERHWPGALTVGAQFRLAVLAIGNLALGLLLALRVSPLQALAALLPSMAVILAFTPGRVTLLVDAVRGAPQYHFEVGGPVPYADWPSYLVRGGSRAVAYYPTNPRRYFQQLSRSEESRWRGWGLHFPSNYDGQGTVEYQRGESDLVRLRIDRSVDAADPAPGWQAGQFPLRPKVVHQVRFRARSDSPQPLVFELWSETRGSLVPQVQIRGEAKPTWQHFSFQFDGPAEPDRAAITIEVRRSESALELADLELSAEGQVLEPEHPLTRFRVRYDYNSLGFRDREVAIPKPPGVFRLVVLGDSVTFGQGVHAADLLTARLERQLNRRGLFRLKQAVQIEVINCALCGYDTRDARRCFERQASRYQPDAVLLVMFSNDLEASPLAPEFRRGDEPPVVPQAGPGDEILPESIARCAEELCQLAGQCQSQGIRFGVALFRYEPMISPWPSLLEAVDEARQRIAFPWVDLGESILERHNAPELFVGSGDMHPNEVGHRLAAEGIEAFLRQQHWLPD